MFQPNLTTEEKRGRQNIFLSLPKDLRTAILSEETADKLYNISWGKYKLKEEQQRIVSFTTGEVMLGIIKLNDFANTLAKRLEINPILAEKKAQDIKQAIFQPIIALLVQTLEETSLKTSPFRATVSPTPTPPVKENIIDLKNLPKE